jgi:hypothetical protein
VSKLTNAIDAKSLVIGVLLTVVVFMSLGASFSNFTTVRAQRLQPDVLAINIPGTPFAIYDGCIYYYQRP